MNFISNLRFVFERSLPVSTTPYGTLCASSQIRGTRIKCFKLTIILKNIRSEFDRTKGTFLLYRPSAEVTSMPGCQRKCLLCRSAQLMKSKRVRVKNDRLELHGKQIKCVQL